MTYIDAHAAYLADWQKRQALMDELDEDGYMPMSCQWEDILKAMRDRDKKEAQTWMAGRLKMRDSAELL